MRACSPTEKVMDRTSDTEEKGGRDMTGGVDRPDAGRQALQTLAVTMNFNAK